MDCTSRKATCVQVALARASSLRAHRLDLIGWATARPLHISAMARASTKRLNYLAELLRIEDYLDLAKDASASVGQVAGICNTASMRPPFSMTLSVARTHGDRE